MTEEQKKMLGLYLLLFTMGNITEAQAATLIQQVNVGDETTSPMTVTTSHTGGNANVVASVNAFGGDNPIGFQGLGITNLGSGVFGLGSAANSTIFTISQPVDTLDGTASVFGIQLKGSDEAPLGEPLQFVFDQNSFQNVQEVQSSSTPSSAPTKKPIFIFPTVSPTGKPVMVITSNPTPAITWSPSGEPTISTAVPTTTKAPSTSPSEQKVPSAAPTNKPITLSPTEAVQVTFAPSGRPTVSPFTPLQTLAPSSTQAPTQNFVSSVVCSFTQDGSGQYLPRIINMTEPGNPTVLCELKDVNNANIQQLVSGNEVHFGELTVHPASGATRFPIAVDDGRCIYNFSQPLQDGNGNGSMAFNWQDEVSGKMCNAQLGFKFPPQDGGPSPYLALLAIPAFIGFLYLLKRAISSSKSEEKPSQRGLVGDIELGNLTGGIIKVSEAGDHFINVAAEREAALTSGGLTGSAQQKEQPSSVVESGGDKKLAASKPLASATKQQGGGIGGDFL